MSLVTEVKPQLIPNIPSLIRLRDLKYRISVDPGKKGAMALLEGMELIDVKDIPVRIEYGNMRLHYRKGVPYEKREEFRYVDAYGVHEILWDWTKEYFVDEAVLEDVTNAFSKDMSKHAFGVLAQGAGIIEGALAAVGLAQPENLHTVTPSVWKRKLGVTKDKKTSLDLARELWPQFATTHFKRKQDDGRAEAALIGYYREITSK